MKKVIIIGSGIGGLIAGNLLAKKGHRVTIFESHSAPGGYTAGFYRHGFYFESGTLAFEASASVFQAMRDIGVLEKIDFVKQKLRFVSSDFDVIPETYADYKRAIYNAYPQDKAGLDRIFAEMDRISGLMGDVDKPMPFLYSGFKMFLAILPYIFTSPGKMKLMKRYSEMTSREFSARYFPVGSRLNQLFGDFGYPDMYALFAASTSGMITDLWTVKSGMQSWADILADNFRSLGGELRLKANVAQIITKDGAAVGVRCGGVEYKADAVIAAGDYKKTFLELLDDRNLIPADLMEKIGRAAVSEGCFTVYLGLNISNEELARQMKTYHVLTLEHQPGYDIYDSRDADFFKKTSLTLFSPSLLNPNLAPAGKSSLMLQTNVPLHWMDNWGGGDKEKYRQLKEKAAAALLDSACRLIPDLKEHIEFQEAATPLTYERFTHNTDGATSAWSWNPQKKFYPSFMSANVKTPVKNLYIGSCWAMQIGGVPGALAAAYQCVKAVD